VELTGPEKAVLLLLSLDESTAAPIVAELDPDDLRKLREVASLMRAVPATALPTVYEEFVNEAGAAVAVPKGGVRYLRRIATRALGEAKTQELFVEGPQTAMERLASADVEALSVVLNEEHPQLVAAILSQLPQEKSVTLLQRLGEEKRGEVLERLGSMKEVPAGLLEEVAMALSAELPTSTSEVKVSVDGVGKTAALVRSLDAKTGEAILGHLASHNAGLAADIRKAMYSFEDLKALDVRALRSVLEAVPSEQLTLSLKTASEQLKTHIFTSMSKRAAERIREDLEIMGGVRLAEVEAAQQEIVQQCLKLAAEGVISLDGGADLV
jgi:flagellar motor switch protein FliG